MKVTSVKQVIYNVTGKTSKKPKQLLLPFPKKKPKEVQMTFKFSKTKEVGQKLNIKV